MSNPPQRRGGGGGVVSLCDLTGNMVRPWADAGFDCVCYDLQHSIRADREERVGRGRITYRWADVRSLTPADFPDPVIVFAFPPCTHLAVSGARDFARKGMRLLIDALETVEACRVLCECAGAPWMIENPVSRLSTLWRKPDHTFDPCEYAGYEGGEAETYTKKTCLWVGAGFMMPATAPVAPTLGSAIHLMPPSADRANLRSATPAGFARAVYMANAPAVRVQGAA
jgi:hypothetical protein